MLVRDLVRRIHVPPVFGEAHRRVADGSTPHFVVNTLGDPYFAGPPHRLVFQKCRVGVCDGMLPRPILQEQWFNATHVELRVRGFRKVCSWQKSKNMYFDD